MGFPKAPFPASLRAPGRGVGEGCWGGKPFPIDPELLLDPAGFEGVEAHARVVEQAVAHQGGVDGLRDMGGELRAKRGGFGGEKLREVVVPGE